MPTKGDRKKSKKEPEPELIEEEIVEGDDQEPEGFMIKKAPWVMKIDGSDHAIPLTGVKFPMFTSGMIDRGELTIETINTAGNSLNHYFRTWLGAPRPRKVEIEALDSTGLPLEHWTFSAVPAAMGFADHNVREDEPWMTQIVFSVSEVKIKPKSEQMK